MRTAILVLVLLAVSLPVLSCDGSPNEIDIPDVSGAPAVALRIPYGLYGVPGPWWRDNATQVEFDKDIWKCRTDSKRARDLSSSQSRKEVAYRVFLDCMTQHAWTRGEPPRIGSAG